MKSLVTAIFILGFNGWVYSQDMGSILDERDGKTYKTVVISVPAEAGIHLKREWMAENLNFKSETSFCYNNNEAYCDAYGRMYGYEAAVESCPQGWRIPSLLDWKEFDFI